MNSDTPTFGGWLRDKMLERRMSLAELSRRAGCHYTYLWRIIHAGTARGRRYVRPSYLLTRKLGEILDAPREALAAAGYQSDLDIQAAREADRADRLAADVSQLHAALPGHEVRTATEVGWRRLPMLGDIRAGDLAEALAASDEYSVFPEWVARGADFCLRVRGESMAPTLLEGDWVAVRRQSAAEPGQLVVARVEEGFTLKRYQEQNGARLLVADNPHWAPLACGPHARIVGVVTGMFRTDDVLRRRPELS